MPSFIELTRGLITLVDDENFDYLNQWKWYYSGRYVMRRDNKLFKTVYMHRVIMETPDGMDTDHINGNRLDNRKDNLRICNNTQNAQNANIRKDNKSGYKGVCFVNRDKKWSARIQKQKIRVSLGNFNTPEDAAKMYDEAAKELHGEFAKLNFSGCEV
jgi:hypothetical protein